MSAPVEVARAMYSKEKESLDAKVAKSIQAWAGEASANGMLTSGPFLFGVWEREEERSRKLCRYFWDNLIDLTIRQDGTLTVEAAAMVRAKAQEVIEGELRQTQDNVLNWVRRTMKDQEPIYLKKVEETREKFFVDVERELTIRKGLMEIKTLETAPSELPRSALVERNFSFIGSEDLRTICERDYEETQRVQIAGAHKATVLLSGSLTEAILLDALQRSEEKARASSKAPAKSLMQWDLQNLLEVAVDIGLVNPGASVLVKAIKDYRNLIHPGREIRTKFRVGAEEAAIARQFLDLIIRDLGGKK